MQCPKGKCQICYDEFDGVDIPGGSLCSGVRLHNDEWKLFLGYLCDMHKQDQTWKPGTFKREKEKAA